ncbi:MAG: EAL domain-containing protein [Nitrosomonadales bacterium]|nr:EAL domain-containing protein [Nitrosomonadales bacterium]
MKMLQTRFPPGRFNLLTKLSVLVTSAVLLVLVILGAYFDDFLKGRFLEDTQQRMQRGYQRLDYNLKEIERELRDGIVFVKTDEKMLASIDLINNYQDKGNYNAFLIDEEKKSIAAELLNRVKLSFNSDIALYDQNGELIAYVTKDDLGYQLSFFSFEGGVRKTFQRYEHHTVYSPGQMPPERGNITLMHKSYYTSDQMMRGSVITYHRMGEALVIKSHQNIFEKNSTRIVAHIEMSKFLDRGYFEQFSRDIDLHITPSFDPKYDAQAQLLRPDEPVPQLDIVQNEHEYTGVLKKEINAGAVYFIAELDKLELNSVLNDSRSNFLMLLVLVAVVILLLLRLVIRKSLERPMSALMAQIRKIEKQDYSMTDSVVTGDELEEISSNVNRLAQAVQEREKLLQQAKNEQEYLSKHDALTNLPNRRLFSESLRLAMDSARRNGSQLAILFLDLDQFKVVNDTLGHDIGDELLIDVSKRLSDVGASKQLLARIGGDEFNILIEGTQDIVVLRKLVEEYLELFHKPFHCAGMELSVSASIGVALYPKDGEDSVTLIKHADLAMYKSKDKGRNNYSFYSDDLAEHVQQRADMTHALKQAIQSGDQFELYYQPKISVATGRIGAIEALIRWNSPNFGRVPPNRFINLAEETGLIVPIGEWILQQGCRDFMRLRQQDIVLEHISINVSNVQLRSDDMMSTLQQVIGASGIEPARIELEITESYIASDVNNAIQVLQGIRDMGIGLAIDDFGTGYSSMSYLKRLPVTRIKIDKSFVDGIPHNKDSVSLTRAVIALAKNFNLAVTAEGVELEEQRKFLELEQCDEIQGFLYAKPMKIEDLIEYYRTTVAKTGNVFHLPGKAGN